MSQKVALTARVSTLKSPKGFGTVVDIRLGTIAVASAIIGGKWNPDQAIGEFKKNPKRFKIASPAAQEVVKAMGIAV